MYSYRRRRSRNPDEELRRLEKAAAAEPHDSEIQHRLTRYRILRGLLSYVEIITAAIAGDAVAKQHLSNNPGIIENVVGRIYRGEYIPGDELDDIYRLQESRILIDDWSDTDYGFLIYWEPGSSPIDPFWFLMERWDDPIPFDEPVPEEDPLSRRHETWDVYQIEIPEDVFEEWDWVSAEDVASSVNESAEELIEQGRNPDVRVRIHVIWSMTGYYGLYEFDQGPLTLDRAEMLERYGADVGWVEDHFAEPEAEEDDDEDEDEDDEYRRNSDVSLRALERNWRISGEDTDFANYAAALYREDKLWEAGLPVNNLQRWMMSADCLVRIEIENIANVLRKSTPDGLALETPATSRPYTVAGPGLSNGGLQQFMLLARGKSFDSGRTGHAGAYIRITPTGEKSIHVIDEATLTSYPEVNEWASSIHTFLPEEWQVTTDFPFCSRCDYSGYSPSANTMLSRGQVECEDCEGAGYHGDYDEEGNPIQEWECDTCEGGGSQECLHPSNGRRRNSLLPHGYD